MATQATGKDGYEVLPPDLPKSKSYLQMKGSEDQGTASMAAGSQSMAAFTESQKLNRFGHRPRKAKSHATLLGFDAKKYLPDDRKDEVMRSISRATSRGFGQDPERSATGSLIEDITLEIEHLKSAGLALDEITEYVYDHLHEQKLPNFMHFLHLDKDGGLDRVPNLWNTQKIFWAAMLVFFVVYNMLYLVSCNWVVFKGFSETIFETSRSTLQVAIKEAEAGVLTSSELQNLIVDAKNQSDAAVLDTAGLESNSIYSRIEDPKRRLLLLSLAGIVGTAEVLWVVVTIIRALNRLRIFYCTKSEYRAYLNIMDFFQHSMPVLSTFSLMKLMSLVHPALLYNHFLECLQTQTLFVGTTHGIVLTSVYFIITRLFIGALALFAFGMKLVSVGLKLIDPSSNLMACTIQVAGLMNQCMGCVLFERVLQDRLFLFIFGGSDTDFKEDELALKGVYWCRLAKQIWEEFWKKGERFKAIVLLMTLDHYDLQMLLINDHDEITGIKTSQSYLTSMSSTEGFQLTQRKNDSR